MLNSVFGTVRKSVTKSVAFAAVAGLAFIATPAAANSAAADTFRVDPATQVGPDITALGEADTNFRSLHSAWDQGDTSKPQAFQSPVAVAVPSLYPLEMQYARKSSGYGRRGAPVKGASTNHKGVDLAAPLGTPIYATADGTVSRAGWATGYGKAVYIEHGNGIQTRYAHMSGIAAAEGTTVRKGDVIGYVGSTGRSSGNHLHYEVRIDGIAQNPSNFMHEARDSMQLAGN